MLKDLIINMAMLISTLSVFSQLQRRFKIQKGTNKFKLSAGILFGLMGCLLMLFSVRLNPKTMIDFRYVPIILSAAFGGSASVFITGSLIGVFRFLINGVNLSSSMGVLAIAISTIGCFYINRTALGKWWKWFWSLVIVLASAITTLVIVLMGHSDTLLISFYFMFFTVFVSAISQSYVDYVLGLNEVFFRIQDEHTKDFLTGLNNVRQFDAIFNNIINNVNSNKSISVLVADIDFFKKVNDTYGHVEGDLVLREIAGILQENKSPQGQVFRMGGEEFSLLISDCSKDGALEIAEVIRQKVEANAFVLSTGKHLKLTISIGVAVFPESAESIEKLIENADTALYAAKRAGRNRVRLFQPT